MSERLRFIIDGFRPDWAVHPGQTLRDVIREQAWSQKELADACGVSPKHVCRVIGGKAAIGTDFALRLERVTNVSAEFWMRLQANYDVAAARPSRKEPPRG